MVLPLIIAGLAIDLAKALDRDSEVSAPKSKSFAPSNSSASSDRYYCNDDDLCQGVGNEEELPTDNYDAPLQINVAPQYYDQLIESLYVIQDCGAWDDFTTHPINITSDDSSKECSIPRNGRTPYAHSDGGRINLCSCIWDLTPIDRAFILMHEWQHIDRRQQGIRYGGDKEERECDLYALRALNSAGFSTEQIISRFVNPGDFLPGYSPGFDPIVSQAEDNLNTSGVNPRYMKKLEDAFAIIKE